MPVNQPEQLMALEVGSRLGHYDMTSKIGEGGMGQVNRATDTKLNRQVALKLLRRVGHGELVVARVGVYSGDCVYDAARYGACRLA